MKNYLFFITIFISHITYSQIASGVLKPNPHSQMDLVALDKGILIPRITLINLNDSYPFDTSLSPIPESLLIYNTTTDNALLPVYYYWYNNQWNKITIQTDINTGEATNSWYLENSTIPATENNENMYHMGNILIGKDQGIPNVTFDIKGAIRAGDPNITAPVGINSFALGNNVVASGNYSSAWGANTIASSYLETVFGASNAINNTSSTIWVKTDPLLQLGNSNTDIDPNNKKNALTILKNGNMGISIIGTDDDAKPTERLDIGSGNLRIRDIINISGTPTDKIVVVDENGILKTNSALDFKGEPGKNGVDGKDGEPGKDGVDGNSTTSHWNIADTTDPATDNDQDIYQTGRVGIGEKKMSPRALLDVKGDALINDLTIGHGNGNISTNTAVGEKALTANTTGTFNTAIGMETFQRNTSGTNNTAIGSRALQYNVTGSFNTAIGFNAGPENTGTSTNLTNTVAIGNNAYVRESNTIRLGNNNIAKVETSGTFWSNGIQITSDRRYKENIQTIPLGLEFINTIHPVEYYRKNDKSNKKEWGLIAQELQQTIEKIGYKNAGIVKEDTANEKYLSVNYIQLIAPMIRAIQELSQENNALKKELQTRNKFLTTNAQIHHKRVTHQHGYSTYYNRVFYSLIIYVYPQIVKKYIQTLS